MKKNLFAILVSLFIGYTCFGQTKTAPAEAAKIKKTIIGFLEWYRAESNDTTTKPYRIFKGGYPDTTTKVRVDTAGLIQYLDSFRKSGFVSEAYINNLFIDFLNKDKRLSAYPIMKELIQIPELNDQYILNTFEPEEILNHIDGSKITHAYIIYKKALVRLYISKYVSMVFTLTKVDGKWLIDYLGGDATANNSLFGQ